MPETQIVKYEDFRGGLNNFQYATKIDDAEIQDCLNVRYEKGRFFTRRGMTVFNSAAISANPINSLFRWYLNSTTKHFFAACNTGVYVANEGDGTWAALTGITLTANKRVRYCPINDTLYICNGVERPFYTTNGAATTQTIAGTPTFENMLFFKERAWGYSGRNIYYSNVLVYPTSGTANGMDSNVLVLPVPNSETIQNWIIWQDRILIFTQNFIYELSCTPQEETIELKPRYNHGTLSPDSVCMVLGNVVFLGIDGYLYIYDGYSAKPIGEQQKPNYERINNSYIDKVQVVFFDNKIHCFCALDSATTNTSALIYDLVVGRNYIDTYAIPITSAFVWDRELSSGRQKIYTGNSTGTVYRFDNGTADNTTAIDAYFTTKRFNWGRFDIRKQWRSFRLDPNSTKTNLKIYYGLDGTAPATEITPDSDYFTHLPAACSGKDIAFKFRNNTKDSAMSVYGFAIEGYVKYIGGEK